MLEDKLEKENKILRGVRLKLFTTPEEEDILYMMIEGRELAYNWATDRLWDNYTLYTIGESNYKVLSKYSLNLEFTEYRSSDECDDPRLRDLHVGVARMAISDAVNSFIRWTRGLMFGNGKPRFHKVKRRAHKSYGLRSGRSFIENGKLHTESIGDLPQLHIELGTNEFDGYGGELSKHGVTKLWYNVRIVKDTDGFYVGFTRPVERNTEIRNLPMTEPIGIDLGCRTTFQLSTEEFFNQPDVSDEEKRINGLNSVITKLYKHRKKRAREKGIHVWEEPQSKTELTKIELRNKAYKRMHNKIKQFYYATINEIVKRNPEAIVIETIYVRKFLNQDIQKNIWKDVKQTYFCMIRYMFESKCNYYMIPLYEVEPNYPSSKICNKCKAEHSNFGSEEIFVCPTCGYTINRDLNASFNLRDVYINQEKDNIKWWNGHGTKLILKDKLTK